MKYHELQVASKKNAKRVGRGIAAGQGKTAGRGTKGQKARTGASSRPGFAGGQNPLMQQLPKLPGFRSFHTAKETVYVGQLDALKAKTVTAETLAEAGLISNAYVSVKLLSKGELKSAVTVKLPAASESAIGAVQKAGGSFEKTARLQRPKTSTKKQDK
jgi:large subunit ribosomal protein L15